MRISVAQLNYRIGDFSGNVEKCINAIEEARKSAADLVLFSELSVSGYPPHDLLESEDFIKSCEVSIEQIAQATTNIAVVIGAPSINRGKSGKRLFNSAYFIQNGEVKEVINKSLLPTYDIFDEYRYFEPANSFKTVDYNGKKLAITICEDLWDEQDFDNEFSSSRLYSLSPMDELARLDPDIILNLSASPFSATRVEMKRKVFTNKAAKHQLPLFMANQTGGNSELIFDGGSMIISPSGQIFDTLGSFTEAIRTYDLDEVIMFPNNIEKSEVDTIGMIHDALVFGIKDFFLKMGFKSAIIGLSGGIDSAVVLTLASRALGAENVNALLMPSMYSSDHSVNDAVALAKNLGTK
jgi:NAD+ synthase (glutamine-hydrolysing)